MTIEKAGAWMPRRGEFAKGAPFQVNYRGLFGLPAVEVDPKRVLLVRGPRPRVPHASARIPVTAFPPDIFSPERAMREFPLEDSIAARVKALACPGL
jgi:hypothetical protein